MHLFSQSLIIVLPCYGELLNVTFSFLSSRCIQWPDQSFLSLCHRRRVAGLSMLYKVNVNSYPCLSSEISSATSRVRHTRAAGMFKLRWSLKYQGVEPPNLQLVFPAGPGLNVE